MLNVKQHAGLRPCAPRTGCGGGIDDVLARPSDVPTSLASPSLIRPSFPTRADTRSSADEQAAQLISQTDKLGAQLSLARYAASPLRCGCPLRGL